MDRRDGARSLVRMHEKHIMKRRYDYTPEKISQLEPDEVFVFGSDLQGLHVGGAAHAAVLRFGAVIGKGVGMQGQSYAIPTVQGQSYATPTMLKPVDTIRPYVDDFIEYARQHKERLFLVTRIGCGKAGFKDEEIAPLFARAMGDNNIVLPKTFVRIIRRTRPLAPRYLVTKIHGRTATLVDMLIEMNKLHHFTSADEALKCLDEDMKFLRKDGDEVAFTCSMRSLCAFARHCFRNGRLDIVMLQEYLKKDFYKGVDKVYMEYVAEKTVKLVEMLNEFRHYTNAEDVVDDFYAATGGANPCGAQVEDYYFDTVGGGVRMKFGDYLRNCWKEFAPHGVLDNRLFRNFMLERHQRGLEKYGLDAVIRRNYESSGAPCYPEKAEPVRGGAGPMYVQNRQTRKWTKSCGGDIWFRMNEKAFEYRRIAKCIRRDPKFIMVPPTGCHSKKFYIIPRDDMSLPGFWIDMRQAIVD